MQFKLTLGAFLLSGLLGVVSAQRECGESAWDVATKNTPECKSDDYECLCKNGNFLVMWSRSQMNCEDHETADAVKEERCAPYSGN
ncbi:hypothetical protein HDZ31DRAFT_60196 [Schizophyllum fasciatum]